MSNGYLDLQGSPSFIAKDGSNLKVGCEGNNSLYLTVDGVNVVTATKTAYTVAVSQAVKLGSLTVPTSNPAAGTAATTLAAANATIDTTNIWQRVTTAAGSTAVILESGTTHGQICIVTVDKDAGGTVAMDAAGTSHVGSGASCVIGVGCGRIFLWDATDAIWCEVGET